MNKPSFLGMVCLLCSGILDTGFAQAFLEPDLATPKVQTKVTENSEESLELLGQVFVGKGPLPPGPLEGHYFLLKGETEGTWSQRIDVARKELKKSPANTGTWLENFATRLSTESSKLEVLAATNAGCVGELTQDTTQTRAVLLVCLEKLGTESVALNLIQYSQRLSVASPEQLALHFYSWKQRLLAKAAPDKALEESLP